MSYWIEVATRSFVRHQFSSGVGQSFSATLSFSHLSDLGIGEFECDPCWVARAEKDIARDNIDDIHVCLPLQQASVIAQNSRQSANGPGALSLVDMRRPWEMTFPEAKTRVLTIVVPRKHLEARLGRDANFHDFRFDKDSPLVQMTVAFLTRLPELADQQNRADHSRLSDLALDFIALSTRAGSAQTLNVSSMRATALLRLKWEVEKHLVDPDLGAEEIAARAGMSLRYANSLLSQENTSLGRYIMARRLLRCRQALEDPAQRSRLVADIAYGWGFVDLAHFSRRFRAVFGMSPTDCRKAAMPAQDGVTRPSRPIEP